MSPWSAIVYTVAALLFFGLGYVVGNSMGDAATYRDCAYSGEAVMVSGGEIRCGIVVRPPAPTPPAAPEPATPQDSRPRRDRPFPPAGFDKTDQG